MKKDIIFSLSSLYRDDFRVTGYRFGKGEKSCCIIGSLRGHEIQQLYMCSLLIKTLSALEKKGDITYDREILVIPSMNNYSTNLSKRFWCLDNTDINRMFPGDENGETTQRIAAGIFSEIKQYQYGIQFASFYIPGVFIPHVRMMKTCKENTSLANLFGLQYVVLRTPTSMERNTLNFNWQINGTAAFSVYTSATESIDEESAQLGVSSVLRFLSRMGIIKYKSHGGYIGTIVEEDDMMNVKCSSAGIYRGFKNSGDEVSQGEILAEIIHPYEGEVLEQITAPADGIIFFRHTAPLVVENNIVFKMIKRLHK
jgi:hypothetical protein